MFNKNGPPGGWPMIVHLQKTDRQATIDRLPILLRLQLGNTTAALVIVRTGVVSQNVVTSIGRQQTIGEALRPEADDRQTEVCGAILGDCETLATTRARRDVAEVELQPAGVEARRKTEVRVGQRAAAALRLLQNFRRGRQARIRGEANHVGLTAKLEALHRRRRRNDQALLLGALFAIPEIDIHRFAGRAQAEVREERPDVGERRNRVAREANVVSTERKVSVEALGREGHNPLRASGQCRIDVVLVHQLIEGDRGVDSLHTEIPGVGNDLAVAEHVAHRVGGRVQVRGNEARVRVLDLTNCPERVDRRGVVGQQRAVFNVDDGTGAKQTAGGVSQAGLGVGVPSAAGEPCADDDVARCAERAARTRGAVDVLDRIEEHGCIRNRTHFDEFNVAGSGTLEGLRACIEVVAGVLERQELLDADAAAFAYEVRNGAGPVCGDHATTTGGFIQGQGSGPDVERRQVEVEVEHFARVQSFDEANLYRLGFGGRVDNRDQRVVAATRGVKRIQKDLAEAVRVEVDGVRDVNHARDICYTRKNCGRQGISFHYNTPRFISQGSVRAIPDTPSQRRDPGKLQEYRTPAPIANQAHLRGFFGGHSLYEYHHSPSSSTQVSLSGRSFCISARGPGAPIAVYATDTTTVQVPASAHSTERISALSQRIGRLCMVPANDDAGFWALKPGE